MPRAAYSGKDGVAANSVRCQPVAKRHATRAIEGVEGARCDPIAALPVRAPPMILLAALLRKFDVVPLIAQAVVPLFWCDVVSPWTISASGAGDHTDGDGDILIS